NVSDKRSIVVPPLIAEQLLEKLIQRDLVVEANSKSYSNVSIEKGKLPFHFALNKNERDDLLLTMHEVEDSVYFSNYEMLFYNGVFYFPLKEQIPILELVSQFGKVDQKLPISKKQADAFLSEVLPSLKKVGEVEISEQVSSEIVQLPLRAKLYLEAKDDFIIGKLEYHYGDHVIDPFSGREDHEVIIIRDVEKEKQIMQLIEYANFHYNG